MQEQAPSSDQTQTASLPLQNALKTDYSKEIFAFRVLSWTQSVEIDVWSFILYKRVECDERTDRELFQRKIHKIVWNTSRID